MGTTVIVGCKLPHGLHLDLDGNRVTLNGSNSAQIIGGHGITEGVDKEFFERWLKVFKDSPMVKGGFIFAHEKAANTAAEANDKQENKNGFEGLNPEKPAPGIEPDKEAMKQPG